MKRSDSNGKQKRGPLTFKHLDEMTALGDFEGLCSVMESASLSMFGGGQEIIGRLGQALQLAAAQDPAKFASRVFARLVAFSSTLTLRLHFAIAETIAEQDKSMRPRFDKNWIMSPDGQDFLHLLVDLQNHLSGLLQGQAAVARMWKLAARPTNTAKQETTGRRIRPRDGRSRSVPHRRIETSIRPPRESLQLNLNGQAKSHDFAN